MGEWMGSSTGSQGFSNIPSPIWVISFLLLISIPLPSLCAPFLCFPFLALLSLLISPPFSPISPSSSSSMVFHNFRINFPLLPLPLLPLFLFHLASPFEHIPENDLAKVCRPVDRPMDLLFLLDGSGSVGGSTFQTQMQLLNRLLDVLDIGPEPNQSQLAVMQYATYSFVEFPFSAHRNKSQLRQAIQRIRHKSGTTKTGKALEKAFQLFRDKASGSRPGNVAKVLVVVSDGRSQDDPISSALRLRQSGISLIALGIGSYVNMEELHQMTGDPNLAFDNQTLGQSVEKFTGIFHRLSTAELCEFARGASHDGADIHCGSEAIEVGTNTRQPFQGRFYLQNGHWDDPECGRIIGGGGTELILRIPLNKCGLERQFSANPKGNFFRGTALIQFHPKFRTGADKQFSIFCFYPDHSTDGGGIGHNGGEGSEIDWQLVREHTQRRERRPWGTLPCIYRIMADHMEQMATVGNEREKGAQRECGVAAMTLGQSWIHSWECDQDQFDVYQSILVHSCFMESSGNVDDSSGGQMLIDQNGCSTVPNLLETPQYAAQLKAFARGVAIRDIGNVNANGQSPIRFRCSLRFCDRLMGECDEMLPPKCGEGGIKEANQLKEEENHEHEQIGMNMNDEKKKEEEEEEAMKNNETGINRQKRRRRERRQTGFPVLIRALNGNGPPPPLVMFSKLPSKRRRPPFLDNNEQTRNSGKGGGGKETSTTSSTTTMETMTSTTMMTLMEEEEGGDNHHKMKMDEKEGQKKMKKLVGKDEEEEANEEEGEIPGGGRADPFQEQQQQQEMNNQNWGTNHTTNGEAMIDPDILAELSEDEIVLFSQELVIQDIEEAEETEGEGKCRRKRPLANFLNGKY